MKNEVEKLKSHWLSYKNTGSLVPLLIFLEHPLAEAKAIISSLNLAPFPYNSLIELAVNGESDYWAVLAVNWLEQGCAVDEKIAAGINRMVELKRASQKTRHRAFSLVKRFEGSDAS